MHRDKWKKKKKKGKINILNPFRPPRTPPLWEHAVISCCPVHRLCHLAFWTWGVNAELGLCLLPELHVRNIMRQGRLTTPLGAEKGGGGGHPPSTCVTLGSRSFHHTPFKLPTDRHILSLSAGNELNGMSVINAQDFSFSSPLPQPSPHRFAVAVYAALWLCTLASEQKNKDEWI